MYCWRLSLSRVVLAMVRRWGPMDGRRAARNLPTVWTAPFTGEYAWLRTENKVFEYACHEANYSFGGIMRGARLLEAELQHQLQVGPGLDRAGFLRKCAANKQNRGLTKALDAAYTHHVGPAVPRDLENRAAGVWDALIKP